MGETETKRKGWIFKSGLKECCRLRPISEERAKTNVLKCVVTTELTGPDFFFFFSVSPYSVGVMLCY